MSLNLNDVVTDGSAKFQVVKSATDLDIASKITNLKQEMGYRQPSTAYTAGQITYHASLPTGWYLECTTAGISSNSELSINNPTIMSDVSDGTVIWKIVQSLSSNGGQVRNDLQFSGGTTANITMPYKNLFMRMIAGSDATQTSSLLLIGGQNESDAGKIALISDKQSSSGSAMLTLAPNGELLLKIPDGQYNDLAGSAIVAKSLGYNGYIKYASGLIMQWGQHDMAQNWDSANNITIAFPISFTTTRTVVASHNDAENANTNVLISSKNAQNPLSSCVFRRYSVDGANQFYGEFSWIAIGY